MVESLQNRPPNFTTTPVLEATASSGFEIATVPIGNQPVAAAILNGFQGNRLVVANAGDQHIGVYKPAQADEYAEEFSVSTGEPKPNDLVLRSGIDVNLGLPPFLQASDSNAVLGLDQGDFNGDGILDIAALTYRLETWYNNAPASRHTVEIVVVLGGWRRRILATERCLSIHRDTGLSESIQVFASGRCEWRFTLGPRGYR